MQNRAVQTRTRRDRQKGWPRVFADAVWVTSRPRGKLSGESSSPRSRLFSLDSKSRPKSSTARSSGYARTSPVSRGTEPPDTAWRSTSDRHATCAFLRSSRCVGLSSALVFLAADGRLSRGSGRADTGLRGEGTAGRWPSLGGGGAIVRKRVSTGSSYPRTWTVGWPGQRREAVRGPTTDARTNMWPKTRGRLPRAMVGECRG